MKLIDKLPYFYEECPITNSIQNGLGSETDNLYSKVDGTTNQLYVSSATWGLELWEKFAGINKTSGSIDDRRAKVISKLKAKGTTTLEVMEAICKTYVNNVNVIEVAREYKILLELIENSEGDLPKEYNLIDMNEAIWEVKPCHLLHELNIGQARVLNIVTDYDNTSFKYHPCNTLYAGELQPNTYYKDSQLEILGATTKPSDLNSAMLGVATLGLAILGV